MAVTIRRRPLLETEEHLRRSQIRDDHRSLVLFTGASGYVGGRLLKALEKVGWPFAALLDDRIVSDSELLLAWELS
jgi:hypothetical protein